MGTNHGERVGNFAFSMNPARPLLLRLQLSAPLSPSLALSLPFGVSSCPPHLVSSPAPGPCCSDRNELSRAPRGGELNQNEFILSLNWTGLCGRRVAMAAISADSGNEKRWGRTVSFNLSAGAEKAKKAASSTVQYSQQLLWSTGKAAWIAGASFLVLVVPLIVQMDRNAQNTVDLEVGASTPPASSSSSAVK